MVPLNLSIDPTFRPRTAGFHWAIVPMYRVGLLVLPWFFHDRVWSKTRPMLCERSLPRSRFFGCRMLHLRDNAVPQGARALVAIPSNTVKSKLFTRGPLSFFLGFGRDLHMAKTVSQSDFKIQSGIAFSKFYSVYSFWSVKKQLSWGNEFRVSILK